MTTYEQKKHLYRQYVAELSGITGRRIGSPKDADRWCDEYIAADYAKWINIWNADGTQLIGFLILCKPPACPEAADRLIDQAYVLPEYRRMGLMQKTVAEYVKNHKGVYSLLVYGQNTAAMEAWDGIFAGLGYQETDPAYSARFAKDGLELKFYVPEKP